MPHGPPDGGAGAADLFSAPTAARPTFQEFHRTASMKTRSLIALLLFALSMAPASQAQSISVDTAGVGAVLDQALNHSEVMQNLAYLSDMIGPRLTGSPAMKKANDWTMERFKAYGMDAHLESYTFGVAWERGDASLKLVSP